MELDLVLLDRDGVINFDSPDYIKTPEEWDALPGALEAVVQMQQHVHVAVCSNQSGVGRGLFDENILASIHDKLNRELKSLGGQALDVYYCPHQPQAGCPCRKPKPDLLIRAMRASHIAPNATLYVGDSEKDLLAATNAGCHAALVLTGNGVTTAASETAQSMLKHGKLLTCDSLAALPEALSFN